MPPGSPGTYRKKSASLDLPAALQQLPRPHRGSICGESKMAEDKPWPNTKEDYELKEVIGKGWTVFKWIMKASSTPWTYLGDCGKVPKGRKAKVWVWWVVLVCVCGITLPLHYHPGPRRCFDGYDKWVSCIPVPWIPTKPAHFSLILLRKGYIRCGWGTWGGYERVFP